MPFTRFTVRQLQVFAAVNELCSFTASADRLGITTQAVSQLVAELESAVGFRLFDRTTRRVVLTNAGRDFCGPVSSVLRHVDAAEVAAADVRNRVTGLVRVGAPMVLASMVLPTVIRAHVDKWPSVVVRIRDLAVDDLVDNVATGDVDLAIGPDRPSGDNVSSEGLFESRWVVWCTPDHPLARFKRVRWVDLRQYPIVAAGRDHERSVTQMRLTDPEGTRVTPIDVVDNISTALGIAAQGLAVTLAPAYVGVLARLLGLRMRRVVGPETMRTVRLYRPTRRALSPAAQEFASHVVRTMSGWTANSLGQGADPAMATSNPILGA